jgi:effector-binding domain-containing protein
LDYKVTVETASPLTLAAVRDTVAISGIARAWKPALDKVWAFLRTNQVPNAGINVFLYRHPESMDNPMDIDFGVEVLNRFEDDGDIQCVETPSGHVAQTVHIGLYDRLSGAHAAIHAWCKANQRRIGGYSWEIYGHWNNDPAKLETTIRYLLA